jgi:protein-tyrosine phosphatase
MNSVYSVFSSISAHYRVIKDRVYYYFYIYEPNEIVEREKTPINLIEDIYTFVDYPSKIDDNLYLGNSYNAANYSHLKDRNIVGIVNVTEEITNYFDDCNEFDYLKINILDNTKTNIIDHIDKIMEFVKNKQKDGNILIHCFAGKSRSATCVLYYLMKKYNYSYEDAHKLLNDKRHCVNINNKFIGDLQEHINIQKNDDISEV